ncbi:MAG: hypothetical protein IJX25_00350 [Clostridia bacterium]|nr:hypothetical protein [Clostridia bacterium]
MIKSRQIVSLAAAQEQQVRAYFIYYLKKMGKEEALTVWEMTSNYARRLATAFLRQHENFFENEENKQKIANKIARLGADKPHSGYKFWEELSVQLSNLEPACEEE